MMQNSGHCRSLSDDVQDVGSFHQKTTQSKDENLLASVSTGKSTSLTMMNHGSGDSFVETRPTLDRCEKNNAAVDYAVPLQDDDNFYCSVKDSGFHTPRKMHPNYSNFSSKQNVVLFVTLCLCFTALGFCVHLHYQMREQNQLMQTVFKDYQFLRRNFDNLRDDYKRLRLELDLERKPKIPIVEDFPVLADDDLEDREDSFPKFQKGASSEDEEEDSTLGSSEGLTVPSSEALMQLLRSNGFPHGVSKSFQRTKRNARRHCRHCPQGTQEGVERIISHHLLTMPKVHLKGLSNITNANDYREANGEYLLWFKEDSAVKYRVELKKEHHQLNRIKGIEILESGIYVVYSQVIVNGSLARSWRRDCAHETVALRCTDDYTCDNITPDYVTVLLSGFVTQDNQGRYNDSIPYPRDTSLQMGIFRLIRQHQIRVRVPDSNGDCRQTLFSTDLHSSYFGLYRIG